MSEKDASERAAFGPKPTKVQREWYETKWRTQPELHQKVLAAARVEEMNAEIEEGLTGKVSSNSVVNFAVQAHIEQMEKRFGPLPDPKDQAALKRYAKKRSETQMEPCPKCGQLVAKK